MLRGFAGRELFWSIAGAFCVRWYLGPWPRGPEKALDPWLASVQRIFVAPDADVDAAGAACLRSAQRSYARELAPVPSSVTQVAPGKRAAGILRRHALFSGRSGAILRAPGAILRAPTETPDSATA